MKWTYSITPSKLVKVALLISLMVLLGCSKKKVKKNSEEQPLPKKVPSASEYRDEISPDEDINKIHLKYVNSSSDLGLTLDLGRQNVHIVMSGTKIKPTLDASQPKADSSQKQNEDGWGEDLSSNDNEASKRELQEVLREIRKAQEAFYQKQYPEALEQVRQTLKKQETAEGFALMGSILYVMGKKKNAKASWERALKINPNMPAVVDMLNRFERSAAEN